VKLENFFASDQRLCKEYSGYFGQFLPPLQKLGQYQICARALKENARANAIFAKAIDKIAELWPN